MEVIEHEPKAWFLIKDENNFFIDVNCNYSFVGFARLIELNENRIAEYLKYGKTYLNELSNNIQHYTLLHYNDRNVNEIRKSKINSHENNL